METLTGKNLIGNTWSSRGNAVLSPINPATGSASETEFFVASPEEIDSAGELASRAALDPNFLDLRKRSAFIYEIADQIEQLGDQLVEAACFETGLPEARIMGEKGRTVFQLRQFAQHMLAGFHLDLSWDQAETERVPIPKPDIRKMNIPVGPVAVFSAGNFPLAFSTAGGDTASALAAGCPVILKGHEGHLMTNEIVSQAILKAAEKCSMPDGVFSFVNGGYDVGEQLVKDPNISSIAFTGSTTGGKALIAYARERDEPIPVFCEMGSINPVLVSSSYQENHLDDLPEILAGSIFLGTGQFCTNPGLLLLEKGSKTSDFVEKLSKSLGAQNPTPMLSSKIFEGFSTRVKQLTGEEPSPKNHSSGFLLSVSGEQFLQDKKLQEEVFGPFSLAVIIENQEELQQILSSLEGQLTGSLYIEEDELHEKGAYWSVLTRRVGRIIYNGVPTGVEVCPSMNHGGPWPASSDQRFTSVGFDAIRRFLRPVSFQDFPEKHLPFELSREGLSSFPHRLNGQLIVPNG